MFYLLNDWPFRLLCSDCTKYSFTFGFRLRAQYGHDIKANALHGSSTAEHAMESMKLVFGDSLEFNPDGTVKGRGESVL